ALGIAQSLSAGARFVGPSAGGVLLDRLSVRSMFLAAAGCAALALAATTLATRARAESAPDAIPIRRSGERVRPNRGHRLPRHVPRAALLRGPERAVRRQADEHAAAHRPPALHSLGAGDRWAALQGTHRTVLPDLLPRPRGDRCPGRQPRPAP